MKRMLVLGIVNPIRWDDGVGWSPDVEDTIPRVVALIEQDIGIMKLCPIRGS